MPTTPRGYPLLTESQTYALVDDYNKLAAKADAEATVTEARAQEVADAAKVYAKTVADAAKAYALDVSTRSADRAMKVATDALATVAPVRDLVDSANSKADQALSTAEAAYAYNQSLVGALPEQIDAVLADGQSDAGQRLLQRVHVGDTYVGVTQQAGATMVDKLHAALAEASASGGTVMLPDEPIDVGEGLKLAGYSCGIVGRQSSLTTNAKTPTVTRSQFYASRQRGPVLDFTGFAWPLNFRGRLPFRDFGVRGSGVADATGANHGIYTTSMHGVSKWDNVMISGCGGTGLVMDKCYFNSMRDILVSVGPTAEGAPSPRAAALSHVSGGVIDLFVYATPYEAKVTRTDGLVYVGDYGDGTSSYTLHSAQNEFRFAFENFILHDGATLVLHRGHDNSIRLVPFDVHRATGALGTSYMRMEPSEFYFPDAGGNEVVGRIPGADQYSDKSVGSGIIVSQKGNAIVGTRAYRSRNVVLRPGSEGTHVSLRGAFLMTANEPGVVDESGAPATQSIRDWVAYPRDGQNPDPARKGTDETRTGTAAAYDTTLQLPLAANATYRVRAEIHYTASTYGQFRFNPPGGATFTITWDAPDQNLVLARTTHHEGSTTYATAYGNGAKQVARAEGTLTTTQVGKLLMQWRANPFGGATATVHASSTLTLERIA